MHDSIEEALYMLYFKILMYLNNYDYQFYKMEPIILGKIANTMYTVNLTMLTQWDVRLEGSIPFDLK